MVGCRGLGRGSQAVGGDGFVMVAIRGVDAVTALLPTAETLLVHNPGDAVATVAVPLLAQFHQDARTAIRLPAPGMDGLNFVGQRLIFYGAWAGGRAAS